MIDEPRRCEVVCIGGVFIRPKWCPYGLLTKERTIAVYDAGRNAGYKYCESIYESGDPPQSLYPVKRFRESFAELDWNEWRGSLDVGLAAAADIFFLDAKGDRNDPAFMSCVVPSWASMLNLDTDVEEDEELTDEQFEQLHDPAFVRGFVDGVVRGLREWPGSG
jgi:hypothetical protein